LTGCLSLKKLPGSTQMVKVHSAFDRKTERNIKCRNFILKVCAAPYYNNL
jgi:hypothetical protein